MSAKMDPSAVALLTVEFEEIRKNRVQAILALHGKLVELEAAKDVEAELSSPGM